MELWVKLSIWIGIFGFFKEFRPEDPYIIQYLMGPTMNFTSEEVNQLIFPVSTYTSLIELVFVFLITDWLRYKPVVLICALSGVICQVILIWCRSITSMMIMEIFYGTMSSTEVAYYTYIYAKVDPQYFQQVTSYMRGAMLSGRFISSIVSQVMLIFHFMEIAELNYLTLVGMICAFVWALGLPSVPRSLYFHRKVEPSTIENGAPPIEVAVGNGVQSNGDINSYNKADNVYEPSSWNDVVEFLWEDFKFAFTNPYVVKWSVWVALSTCGYILFMGYVQILWETVDNSVTHYNGAVEAVYTLTSASASFLFGHIILDWRIHGDCFLGVLTLVEGVLVLLSASSTSTLFCYAVYIIFGTLYHIMMTVAYSEIAKHIKPDSYGLVFGVNSFASLIIQTVMTYLVASNQMFALPIRTEFVVYGLYFTVLGAFYLAKAVFTYFRLCTSSSLTPEDPGS